MSNNKMATFVYQGRFSPALLKHVIENAGNLDSAMSASIEAFGGKLVRCVFRANSGDPIGFVEFPSEIAARSWNIFYSRQDGVVESRIFKMLDVEDLREMNCQISNCQSAAMAHRTV